MKNDRMAARDERLPDDYYVQAFLTVLEVVAATCAPILTDRERHWSAAIRSLSVDAQRLYIRLMMRRGAHFRMQRLRYAEIGDPEAARQELVLHELASDAAPEGLAGLLAAYTVPEIERLLSVPAGAGCRRADRVMALVQRDDPRDRQCLAEASRWISPLGHDVFAVHRLCFFGNLRQDLSEFVLRDLGAVRYAPYPIGRDGSLFRSRHQLDCHLRFYECEMLFDSCRRRDVDALAALCDRLPPSVPGDAPLQRRLDRLRCSLARCFERLGERSRALALYADSERPPARERRVRLLDAQGLEEQGTLVAQAMQRAPLGDAEREFAERRLAGGARRRAFRPSTTTLTLRADGRRVERVAREYYARRGECVWSENRLVAGMCGLWAWDIVFSPIAGAFFNPFQSGPADFREPGFRLRRAGAFQARLDELRGPDGSSHLLERVVDALSDHHGTANPLVSWEIMTPALLARAVERVPADHWAAMFERLLDDPGENACGLPDLVSFPRDGGYEFIEIKGPGDALQSNQRRWLRHFAAHGIPARVVNIKWARTTERLVDAS